MRLSGRLGSVLCCRGIWHYDLILGYSICFSCCSHAIVSGGGIVEKVYRQWQLYGKAKPIADSAAATVSTNKADRQKTKENLNLRQEALVH